MPSWGEQYDRKVELGSNVEFHLNGKHDQRSHGGGGISGIVHRYHDKKLAKRRDSLIKHIDDKIQANIEDLEDTEKGNHILRKSKSRPEGHELFPNEVPEFRKEARESIKEFKKLREKAHKPDVTEDELKSIEKQAGKH